MTSEFLICYQINLSYFTGFKYQILSFIQTFVHHLNGLKVEVDYIPETRFFFLPMILGAKGYEACLQHKF